MMDMAVKNLFDAVVDEKLQLSVVQQLTKKMSKTDRRIDKN